MLGDQAASAARIDDAFVRELISRTILAAGAEGRVEGQTFVQPVDMPRDTLLPLALIINECVANAVEHGFPGDGRGEIVVRLEALTEESNAYQLTVTDNGQGLPPHFDPANAPSLGLAFINAFAVQLGGAFRLQAGGRGAVARLTFQRG